MIRVLVNKAWLYQELLLISCHRGPIVPRMCFFVKSMLFVKTATKSVLFCPTGATLKPVCCTLIPRNPWTITSMQHRHRKIGKIWVVSRQHQQMKKYTLFWVLISAFVQHFGINHGIWGVFYLNGAKYSCSPLPNIAGWGWCIRWALGSSTYDLCIALLHELCLIFPNQGIEI